MTTFKMTLLAAVAIGAAFIGTASAMPLSTAPATGESALHHVRVVCDAWGRCYNEYAGRSSRHYSSNQHYRNRNYAYGNDRYDRRYRNSGHAVGIGPFGIWVR